MASQFNRIYDLRIDTIDGDALQISELQVEFSIELTSSSDPNGSVIKIYNLSEFNRDRIDTEGNLSLSVGYLNQGVTELYIGQISSFFHVQQGPDIITNITIGDGYVPLKDTRVVKTYAANSSVDSIIRDLAKRMGVAIGTLSNTGLGTGQGLSKTFPRGYPASGQARAVLDDITGLSGLEWSIQAGSLIVLPKDGTRLEVEIPVRKETGLIGTPSPTSQKLGRKKKKNQNGIRFQTLLNPLIQIGRRVRVISKFYPEGTVVRITKVNHRGSFRGQDWTTSAEGEIIAG
jgi:hypothetical protein